MVDDLEKTASWEYQCHHLLIECWKAVEHSWKPEKNDRPLGIKYSSSLLITLFQTWVLYKESGSVNLLSWTPMDMMLVDELIQDRKGSHTCRAHAEKQQANSRLPQEG